jgi:hypothetical protein
MRILLGFLLLLCGFTCVADEEQEAFVAGSKHRTINRSTEILS